MYPSLDSIHARIPQGSFDIIALATGQYPVRVGLGFGLDLGLLLTGGSFDLRHRGYNYTINYYNI